MIGNGQKQPLEFSEYGAFTTIDCSCEKIFKGVVFSWSRRFTITGSGSVDIVIDHSGVADGKDVIIFPVAFSASLGPIEIDLYAGVTASEDGTLWGGVNRDLNLNTQPGTVIRLNPTISDIGTASNFQFEIPSSIGVGQTAVFGETSDSLLLKTRKDVKFAYRLTNISTNDARCTFAYTVKETESIY